jgi:tight adherence protein C
MTADTFALVSAMVGFTVIFLLSVGIIQVINRGVRKQEIVQKIRTSGVVPHSQFSNSRADQKTMLDSLLAPLKNIGEKRIPTDSIRYTQGRQRFLQAGIRNPAAMPLFWGTKIMLAFVLAAGFAIARVSMVQLLMPQVTLAVGVLVALLGFYLPDVWLTLKIGSRKDTFFEGLPDALDLMVVCVESSMGLDASINRVAEEMALSNQVVSDELKLVNLELRAGMKRSDALRNLSKRIDLDDVRNLTTLLIQTDKFGTSIAKALRVFSDSFRTKRFQKAEEIAAKIPLKLIFPLGLFIFPATFVVAIGPAVIRIFDTVLKVTL